MRLSYAYPKLAVSSVNRDVVMSNSPVGRVQKYNLFFIFLQIAFSL